MWDWYIILGGSCGIATSMQQEGADGGNLNVVDRYHNGRHEGLQGTVRQDQAAMRGGRVTRQDEATRWGKRTRQGKGTGRTRG